MTSPKQQKLIFIFVVLVALLNFPMLSIFNRPILIGGIPVFFVYIFGLWTAVILVLYFWIGRTHDEE